jgi:cold shock protein
MIKGIVKFYNQGKGFGFITPDDGGADVFVPAATLSASNVNSLKTGQRVKSPLPATDLPSLSTANRANLPKHAIGDGEFRSKLRGNY